MVVLVNIYGHMLPDMVITLLLIIEFCVHATMEAHAVPVPSFVSNDYYCESGSGFGGCDHPNRLYSNDVLWDGQQCGGVKVPAAHTPTCRGSSRHSVRPPLRTLN